MCVCRESLRDPAGLEGGAGVHRPGRDPGLLVPGAGPSCPWGRSSIRAEIQRDLFRSH